MPLFIPYVIIAAIGIGICIYIIMKSDDYGHQGPSSARIRVRARENVSSSDSRINPDSNGNSQRPTLTSNNVRHRDNTTYVSAECVVCYGVSSVVLRPCGHLCVCRSCANALMNRNSNFWKCPLCRDEIQEFGFKTRPVV